MKRCKNAQDFVPLRGAARQHNAECIRSLVADQWGSAEVPDGQALQDKPVAMLAEAIAETRHDLGDEGIGQEGRRLIDEDHADKKSGCCAQTATGRMRPVIEFGDRLGNPGACSSLIAWKRPFMKFDTVIAETFASAATWRRVAAFPAELVFAGRGFFKIAPEAFAGGRRAGTSAAADAMASRTIGPAAPPPGCDPRP
jgi:hypothetical protein